MNRRSFLSSLLALPVVPRLVPQEAEEPKRYGKWTEVSDEEWERYKRAECEFLGLKVLGDSRAGSEVEIEYVNLDRLKLAPWGINDQLHALRDMIAE